MPNLRDNDGRKTFVSDDTLNLPDVIFSTLNVHWSDSRNSDASAPPQPAEERA